MMLHVDVLEAIARSVVNEPWGLGLPYLNNAEAASPYYRFLHGVVSLLKPHIVVECGTYIGVAAEHMALANAGTHVISVDHSTRTEAINAAKRHGNIELIHGDTVSSAYIVERICNELHCAVGLLFLDSQHDSDTPRAEFEAYFHLLEDESLVVCDDILDPKMKIFWDWLPGDKHEMHFLHPSQYPNFPEPGFGISIIRKNCSHDFEAVWLTNDLLGYRCKLCKVETVEI